MAGPSPIGIYSSSQSLNPSFPESGDKDEIAAFLKVKLAQTISIAELVEIINKMHIAEKKDKYNSLIIWAHVQDLLGDGKALQTLPFLFALGANYQGKQRFVEIITALTPDQVSPFIVGLRQNRGPLVGRWHPDQFVQAILEETLSSNRLPTPLRQPLNEIKLQIDIAVEKLPAFASDRFDIKVNALKEKELLTPKNRVTWDVCLKLLNANFVLATPAIIEDGCGHAVASSMNQGIALSSGLLHLIRHLAPHLSKKNMAAYLSNDAARALSKAESLPQPLRDAECFNVLNKEKLRILSSLNETDKATICHHFEEALLQFIFETAFGQDSCFGRYIDDRQENWSDYWLSKHSVDHAPDLHLVKVDAKYIPVETDRGYHLGMVSFKDETSMGKLALWEYLPEDISKNPTLIVIQHRQNVVNNTLKWLIAIAKQL